MLFFWPSSTINNALLALETRFSFLFFFYYLNKHDIDSDFEQHAFYSKLPCGNLSTQLLII